MTTRDELSSVLQKLENRLCEKIGRRYSKFIEFAKTIIESFEDDIKEGILDIRSQLALDSGSEGIGRQMVSAFEFQQHLGSKQINNYSNEFKNLMEFPYQIKTESPFREKPSGIFIEQMQGDISYTNLASTSPFSSTTLRVDPAINGNLFGQNLFSGNSASSISDIQQNINRLGEAKSSGHTPEKKLLAKEIGRQLKHIRPVATNIDVPEMKVNGMQESDETKVFDISGNNDFKDKKRPMTGAERQRLFRYRKKLQEANVNMNDQDSERQPIFSENGIRKLRKKI